MPRRPPPEMDEETQALYDQFLDAALDEDWELVDQLRGQLKPLGVLDRPYTKVCCGPVEAGVPPSWQSKTRRHRFLFYRMYGEERCMYCGCQRRRP